MTNGWLQVAQEALKVPGLLVEIYGDLARPGVQQAGKALGTVMGLGNTILWPIQWANERSRVYLERNLEDYRSRLAALPMDKVVEVPPEIGVPLAEKLGYVSDTKLADLYVTLLAKASSSECSWQAHPSFVNVINNLTPDEAQLLEQFVGEDNALEFLSARYVEEQTGTYTVGADILIAATLLNPLVYPTNVGAYFHNMAGLGLVSIFEDRTISGPEAYADLERHWEAIYTPKTPPDKKLQFHRGAIALTNFGYQFVQACHIK